MVDIDAASELQAPNTVQYSTRSDMIPHSISVFSREIRRVARRSSSACLALVHGASVEKGEEISAWPQVKRILRVHYLRVQSRYAEVT